jgi:peptidyl-prolyl cis-trans isomerase C
LAVIFFVESIMQSSNTQLGLKTVVGLAFSLLTAHAVAQPTGISDDDAIITWKNGKVTIADLESDLLKMPATEREELKKNPRLLLQVVDNIQVYKELTNRARSAGYVDKKVKLAAEIAADRLIGALYLTTESEKQKVALGDLRAAATEQYKTNPAKYERPERINAAHILIKMNSADDAAAKAKIDDLYKQIKAGANFAELAKLHSDDRGSKERGGTLGQFAKGNMVKPFEDAAFALKSPGDLSEPFRSQFGWHIIRLIERFSAGVQKFEDVEEEIVNELAGKSISKQKEAVLSEIRNDPTLKIDSAVFERYAGVKATAK